MIRAIVRDVTVRVVCAAVVITLSLCGGPAQAQSTLGGSQFQSQWYQPGEQNKLQVATFNLTPREPISDNMEQVRAMAANVVEVVKTMLYAQTGEKAAASQGRKLWYDPNTLTLTVTDYTDNIQRVSQYIRSQATTSQPKGRSEIIPLKHQTASEVSDLLNRTMGLSPAAAAAGGTTGGNSVTKTLRTSQSGTASGAELVFRDLRMRLVRINAGDLNDKSSWSADFVIRTGTTSEDRSIQAFRSEFIDNYEIYVIDIRSSGATAVGGGTTQGTAKVQVTYNANLTGTGTGTGQ